MTSPFADDTAPEQSAPAPAAPLPQPSKKTELKVKAASWATFLVSLAGLTLLQSTATDMVADLPDWLETAAYSLLLAATTWLTGYNTRTRPDGLSQSTVDAIAAWMRTRAARSPRLH